MAMGYKLSESQDAISLAYTLAEEEPVSPHALAFLLDVATLKAKVRSGCSERNKSPQARL